MAVDLQVHMDGKPGASTERNQRGFVKRQCSEYVYRCRWAAKHVLGHFSC